MILLLYSDSSKDMEDGVRTLLWYVHASVCVSILYLFTSVCVAVVYYFTWFSESVIH